MREMKKERCFQFFKQLFSLDDVSLLSVSVGLFDGIFTFWKWFDKGFFASLKDNAIVRGLGKLFISDRSLIEGEIDAAIMGPDGKDIRELFFHTKR